MCKYGYLCIHFIDNMLASYQCIIECVSMGIFAYIKAYMSIYVYLTTYKGIDVCIFVYIALCIFYLSINVVAYSFFQ